MTTFTTCTTYTRVFAFSSLEKILQGCNVHPNVHHVHLFNDLQASLGYARDFANRLPIRSRLLSGSSLSKNESHCRNLAGWTARLRGTVLPLLPYLRSDIK